MCASVAQAVADAECKLLAFRGLGTGTAVRRVVTSARRFSGAAAVVGVLNVIT